MKKYITFIILCLAIIYSCESDDYKLDGGISDPNVYKSTYDYLASNRLFDTLVLAINKADMKKLIDQETTLFAPTNYSFNQYITKKTTEGRAIYNDPNYQYSFDSIPVQLLKDSLPMYLFKGKYERTNLTQEGMVVKSYAGTELRLSLEPQKIFENDLTITPSFVFITYKVGKVWDAWDASGIASSEKDIKIRAQTSGLISTNGIIHVLPNNHLLFFK